MPKISICHLKLSKRSLSLAIRLRVRTSDGEFERVASLCSVPAGDTSDLSTLCLTRKPFGLCFFRRKDPCGSDSISFPTVTINKAWWEQWLPSCDHKDTISQRSVPGALTLGDVCSFRVAGGGRKQKASMIKWVWHERKLCPLLRELNHVLKTETLEDGCPVAQLCLTLCKPLDCSIPGFAVLHRLPGFNPVFHKRVFLELYHRPALASGGTLWKAEFRNDDLSHLLSNS